MIEFKYFLGIDQTGATSKNGMKAKPLKIAFAKRNKKSWRIFTRDDSKRPLVLENLNLSSLKKLADKFEITWPNPELAILADCVFGMPQNLFPSLGGKTPHENLWKLFLKTLNHSHQGAHYGLKVSESFFSVFPGKNKSNTKRLCEEISGSNSLFTTRPFQKNIQTGSYRIWRDLVSESAQPWLNVWPFANLEVYNPDHSWIFEGYPTFVWRNLLGIPFRNPITLKKKLSSEPFKSLIQIDSLSKLELDPDLCDATVLALSGILLQDRKKLLSPFKGFWDQSANTKEGWISGIELPKT